MVIYDLAMKLKEDAINLYSDLAVKEEDEAIKQVFKVIAADEERHFEVFKKVKNFIPIYSYEINEKSSSKVLLKKGLNMENHEPGCKQLEAYRKAYKKEQDNIYLYKRLVEETEDAVEKEIFKKLLREKEDHLTTLYTIIEMCV